MKAFSFNVLRGDSVVPLRLGPKRFGPGCLKQEHQIDDRQQQPFRPRREWRGMPRPGY